MESLDKLGHCRLCILLFLLGNRCLDLDLRVFMKSDTRTGLEPPDRLAFFVDVDSLFRDFYQIVVQLLRLLYDLHLTVLQL